MACAGYCAAVSSTIRNDGCITWPTRESKSRTQRDSADDRPATTIPTARFVGLAAALAIVVGVILCDRRPRPEAHRRHHDAVDLRSVIVRALARWASSAFVGDYQGQPTLWVRSLDAAEAQPLPGTQGALRPFWSPDSRSIGFFAFTNSNGSTQMRATVVVIIAGTAAAWGAGGTILLSGRMSRTISPSPTGLLRVDVAGGASDIATWPVPQSTGHRYPEFLPGGRQFLFFAGGADDVRGVYVGSLDSSETTRVVASDSQGAYLPPEWLLFVRQGALLAQRFDISRRIVTGGSHGGQTRSRPARDNGAASWTSDATVFAYRSWAGTQLAWFDRSGRALGTLGSSQEAGVSNLALSPDGRRVVAERTVQNATALWLLDPSHQVLFTRSGNASMARYPVWSRSGDRIAFASVRTGSVQLSARPLGRHRR
jgi:hypothetical protein